MQIQLTQGKYTTVDDELSHLVSGFKWYYHKGYAERKKTGANHIAIRMHRMLWEAVNGPIPEGSEIDHRDGDGVNNRMENLRVVDDRQQAINRKNRREGKTSSKHPGVYWNKRANKWQVRATVNGIDRHIGYFTDEDEAGMVYQSVVDSLRLRGSATMVAHVF